MQTNKQNKGEGLSNVRRVYGKLPNSNCPMRQCCVNIAGASDSVAIAGYLENF